MTATFFLVRHAAHAALNRLLAGRMPGIHLNGEGVAEARRLARRLACERVTQVHSSPRERAIETAEEIAAVVGGEVAIDEALDEIDCGKWTGRSFDELAGDPRWTSWNKSRASARAPEGESMAEVERRVASYLDRHAHRLPEARIVAVSHGDVIKAALFACLGLSLDKVGSVEIGPASISTIVIGDWGAKILSVNGWVPP